MKQRLNRLIAASALVALALPVLAACYAEDPDNNINCSTANVSICQSTWNGDIVNGICNDTVNKPRLVVVDNGKGQNSGVACACSCTYKIDGVEHTVSGQVGQRTYDQLNNHNCPS